jgi:hypothetical protein
MLQNAIFRCGFWVHQVLTRYELLRNSCWNMLKVLISLMLESSSIHFCGSEVWNLYNARVQEWKYNLLCSSHLPDKERRGDRVKREERGYRWKRHGSVVIWDSFNFSKAYSELKQLFEVPELRQHCFREYNIPFLWWKVNKWGIRDKSPVLKMPHNLCRYSTLK